MKKNNMSPILGLLIVLVLTIGALIVFVSQMGGEPEVSAPITDTSANDNSIDETKSDTSDFNETGDIESNEPSDEQSNADQSVESKDESKTESKDESKDESKNESKDESKEPDEPSYTYEYKIDISEYLQYIEPSDRDEYLFLVNYENILSKDYKPTDLIDVVNTRNGWPTQKLRKTAAKALEALFAEMKEEGMLYVNNDSGYKHSVTSAYRSYAQQKENFENKVQRVKNENPGISQEEAEIKAATAVARPGTSEHQTGLCLDMHNMSSAVQSFKDQKAAKWLAENSYKFGYILRYPEDKVDITKIMYEPWHFRYVGRYHATRMYELDMCLEEYMEYLEKNS